MAYEISQFDIPSRQLLTSNARTEPRTCTEIGNATVTQSVFGKARVRVICAHDKVRRVRILSSVLGLTIVIAIWQLTEHGRAWLENASDQSAKATIQVSQPAFMPEYRPAPTSRQGDSRSSANALPFQLMPRPLPPPPKPVAQPNPQTAAANTAAQGSATASAQAKAPTMPLSQPVGPVTTATKTTPPAQPQKVAPVAQPSTTAPPATTTPAPAPAPITKKAAAPQNKEAPAPQPTAVTTQPAEPASVQP